jgi:AcrR family transcriptional regulator
VDQRPIGTFQDDDGAAERARLRVAVIELVVEHGCDRTSVEMIVARAGVGRDAFEREFTDFNACLIDAYLVQADEFDRRMQASVAAEESWRDGLRAAAYAAAAFVHERPQEVLFGGMGLQQAGPEVQAYRADRLQRLVDLIDAGRGELDDPDSLNRSVAEGILGSIFETMVKGLHDGAIGNPEAFIPDLMYIAVRPYLGHEVAREELDIPPPPGLGGSAGSL